MLGGMIGVALGVGSAIAVAGLVNSILPSSHWPLTISLEAIAVALAFSASVGIAFGFFPALKASRMDPIESLRYE